jgi:hypothetical protein
MRIREALVAVALVEGLVGVVACVGRDANLGDLPPAGSSGSAGSSLTAGTPDAPDRPTTSGGSETGSTGGAGGTGGSSGGASSGDPFDGGPDHADGDGGRVCGASETLGYNRPGCGSEAPPPICIGPGDACLSLVCDCEGRTRGDGCGWATFPFASFGACPPPEDAPDRSSCPPWAGKETGSAVTGVMNITALSFDDAGTSSCGAQLANITFDFSPNDPAAYPTIAIDQHELQFVKAPLTRACAERLGLHIGSMMNGYFSGVSFTNCEMSFEYEPAFEDRKKYEACYLDFACVDGG